MAPMKYASSVKGITQALKGKILEFLVFILIKVSRKVLHIFVFSFF